MIKLIIIGASFVASMMFPTVPTPHQEVRTDGPTIVNQVQDKVAVEPIKEKPKEIAKVEPKPVPKPEPAKPVQKTVQVTGNKETWLRASGIPQDQWWAVDSIVSRESGWNPNAVNASSGACGLGQQLPCGKWAGAWNDPVAALKAQYGYVTARYGGYPQAVAFWNANHWY